MNSQSTKQGAPVAVLSRTNDLPLLMFLWRWKVSTTAALSRKFYPERSAPAAYLRLWKLERAGFIKSTCNHTANVFLWTLDKRGFSVVRPYIPNMREEGYLSENLFHDLMVTAIHLGDCFFNELDAIEFVTEQELRRLDPVAFPEWVPNSNRRPDGYWGIKKALGHKVVALEVELSVKVDTEYESIARFYEEREGIHQILWVVRRASIAEKIHAVMEKVTRRTFKHSFLILDPFYSLGWQATIHCGLDSGNTVNHILENKPLTNLKPVSGQFSLDARKTPHKSKHCELFRP